MSLIAFRGLFLGLAGILSVSAKGAEVSWTDVSCSISNSPSSNVEFMSDSQSKVVISYNDIERKGSGSMLLNSKDGNLVAKATFSLIPRTSSSEIEGLVSLETRDGEVMAKSRSRMHFEKNAEVSSLYKKATLYLIASDRIGKHIELILECVPSIGNN
jgi:hypothetical protein